MSTVGIVIVSHSPLVAEGTADMVRQMVGDTAPLASCGGNPDGGLGTSVEAILAAIERAWSEAGVAVLVDLGGAATNSEMAVEMLPPERAARVVVCNAPIVEGAVIAATEASGGASLAAVKRAAEGLSPAEESEPATAANKAEGSILMTHAAGLHARPAVKLTKLAKTFASRIELATAPTGPWINAKSIVKVMAAKAPRNTALYFRAEGNDAADAVDAVVALVAGDFDGAAPPSPREETRAEAG
jgi:dihydroxyacetone kinase phosphotransfer subunit